MFDRNGTAIYKDVHLYSSEFGKEGAEMRCFGYRNTDGKIILGQDKVGEQRIYLEQEELLTTHNWVVDYDTNQT